MDILILIVLAIVPAAVCLFLLTRQDKAHPEPKKKLAAAFFAGIGSLLLTLLITNIFPVNAKEWGMGAIIDGLGEAFFEAAIPEEVAKFICLFLVIWKSKEFDEYLDGVIYAAFVGMGFATVENILYVLDNGIGNAILRAFTSVPGHFCDAVIMGYFFSLAKFDKAHRMSNLFKALFFAILAHGIYDGLIMVGTGLGDSTFEVLFALILVVVFIVFNVKIWKLSIRKIRELVQRDKAGGEAAPQKAA